MSSPSPYLPYVPDVLGRGLGGEHPDGPAATSGPAASMFVDISGFTRLSEAHAGEGTRGTEFIGNLLNAYFGALVDHVGAHGGDVLKFAGDALFAVWTAEPDRGGAAEAVARAAACAVEVHAIVADQLPSGNRADRAEGIVTRVGVGYGQLDVVRIGGVLGRWEVAVMGSAVGEAIAGQAAAPPGGTALSGAAAGLLGLPVQGVQVLHGAPVAVPRRSLERSVVPDARLGELRALVPGAIRARLDAGLSAWLAELRPVSAIFANLPDFDLGAAARLGELQGALREVQGALYRFEGALDKLVADDKGLSVLAALGLPPFAHEDDPHRAVRAAMALRESLAEVGLRCRVGVATGDVFCGTIGSERRREYTILGDTVNLSARLALAAADGEILVDERTRDATKGLRFHAMAPLNLKGRAHPVPAYRPLEAEVGGHVQRHASAVGRAVELAAVEALVAAAAGSDASAVRVLILQGDAGLGKSLLLGLATSRCADLGVEVLPAAGDAVEQLGAMHAFRRVLEQVLGEPLDRADFLVGALPSSMVADAPLLDPVVFTGLTASAVLGKYTSQARSERQRDVALELLRHHARKRRCLLVLEDLHWVDSASADLLVGVLEQVPELRVLITTRPTEHRLESLLRRATGGVRHMVLGPLGRSEVADLIRQQLGVATVPEELQNLVHERSAGNPFHVREVIRAMRAAGHLQVEARRVQLATDVDLWDPERVPSSLAGLLSSRLDRLPPMAQLTLKVASVVGVVFHEGVLAAVHPVVDERSRVGRHLAVLAGAQLVRPLDEGRWTFEHALARDVTYKQLLHSQREALHAAVAEWLTAQAARGARVERAVLALHWTRAGRKAEAVDALEAAGDEAARSHLMREVLRLYAKLLEIDPDAEPRRRSVWHGALGEAWYRLGNPEAALQHLERALGLMGEAVPPPGARRALGALPHLRVHLWGLVAGRPPVPPAEVEWLARETHLCEVASHCGSWMEDAATMLYVSLRGVNIAERGVLQGALSGLYANMATLAGFLLGDAAARFYEQRSLSRALPDEDPYHVGVGAFFLGGVHLARGRFDRARWNLDRSLQGFHTTGDRHEADTVLLTRYALDLQRGTDLGGAAQAAMEVRRRSAEHGDHQLEANALGFIARVHRLQGRTEEALGVALEGEALLARGLGVTDHFTRRHILACALITRLDAGDVTGATEAVRRLQARGYLKEAFATPVSYLPECTAEALVRLWLIAGSEFREPARTAVASLRRQARLLVARRGMAQLWWGTEALLLGWPALARRRWKRGLRLAQELDIRPEANAQRELLAALEGSATAALERVRRGLSGVVPPGPQEPASA